MSEQGPIQGVEYRLLLWPRAVHHGQDALGEALAGSFRPK